MAAYTGSIRIILGPMGASKTTTLILAVRRFDQQKKTTIIIKYAGDTRYSVDNVQAHNNLKYKALVARYLSDVDSDIKEYDVIGIDEGQFFPDIKKYVLLWVERGKIIIIAALDGGENQEVFNQSLLELIPRAETVQKLSAVCTNCQADAAFTKRKPGKFDTPIGGLEQYSPLCRKCLYKMENDDNENDVDDEHNEHNVN